MVDWTRFFVLVVTLGAIAAAVSTTLAAKPPGRWDWVVALALLSLVFTGRVRKVRGRIHVSNISIIYLAAIPLVGPVGSLVCALLPIAVGGDEWLKRLYNVSLRVLATLAGSWVYFASGGPRVPDWTAGRLPVAHLGLSLSLAGLAFTVTNLALLALVVRIGEGAPLPSVVRTLGPSMLFGYLGYAITAFLLVILWGAVGLGWVAAILLLPTLFLAEWAIQQYVQEWRARQDSLSAVQDALEVRFPGSRQHDERVRAVAEQVANRLGLPASEVETIATAAQLRDVGLLAMPAPARHVEEPLHPVDRAALHQHPLDAERVLGHITFLWGTCELIAAHHERMDGRGYPRGLVGERIPLGGRVIAVADAYVNLTHPQANRAPLAPAAAVAECEKRPDQLDPQVVAVLAAVVARLPRPSLEGDESTRRPAVSAARGSLVDHAHPWFDGEIVVAR